MTDEVKQQIREELLKIIGEIEVFVFNNSSIFSDWYVGITEDVQKRLYRDHNVKNTCITVKAPSIGFARIIKNYFTEDRGMNSASDDGNDRTLYVYAYKKQYYTKENID